MYAVLQQIVPFVFIITWFGAAIVLAVRMLAKQRDYLRRFPPVEGVSLDTQIGGNPFGSVNRAIYRVAQQEQDDPELEQLRLAVWRHSRYLFIWTLGFPLLILGIGALLVLVGVIH